jgi:hypothetical protein
MWERNLFRKLPINRHVWRNRLIGTCNVVKDTTTSSSEYVASNYFVDDSEQ